jgi:3-oxoadipate CoA-transferase beta subunit
MSTASRYTREQMAERVARDIPEGAYVNLGIGLPTKVANYLPAEREVFLHSENGCSAWARRRRPARKTKT